MPTMNINYCETCAISSPNQQSQTGRVCNLWQAAVKDTDFCSHHTKSLWKCDCCGNQFWDNPIITTITSSTGSTTIDSVICMQCFKQLGKCSTCAHANTCRFETDPSSLPKTVQKQIRQGPMISVMQVMNPERVRITCQDGCPCWSQDSLCSRHNHGTCPQYQMNRV